MAQALPVVHRLPADASLADFIAEAERQLTASGWRITQRLHEPEAAWHLAASNGCRWRVVQVLVPGTVAPLRQDARQRLGSAAQLPAKFGSMEQWHAHVRPGGRVGFGVDLLSGYAWSSEVMSDAALAARFGTTS